MSFYKRILSSFFWVALIIFTLAGLTFGITLIHLQQTLPDVEVLKDMQLQVPLRIYSKDRELIAEFGEKKRIPVPLHEIPVSLVQAMLATEDSRFYQHTGVDFLGLTRAASRFIVTGHAEQGGSTITMQVARNFFLTPKKTISRKIQEILLAIKIDKELSKEKILELYLNKIYFGNRAYGVAAAAKVYFGKNLKDLTLPEMALIAGLPKAPSTLNPLINPEGAVKRRNHVLRRMYEQGYISQDALDKAQRAPAGASYHNLVSNNIKAPYVAEMVRQALLEHFGENIYTQGLQIYTTIDSHLQEAANTAMHRGLLAYDRRHGFRGPIKQWGNYSDDREHRWLKKLNKLPIVEGAYPAAITAVRSGASVRALLPDRRHVSIRWSQMTWNGHPVRNIKEGSVIYITKNASDQWELTQLPQIEGALVAMDPNTGGILGLVGGYSFERSKFNRATQAERQPGSSFKPFVYAAALARGYTLSTLINDAPIVVNTPGSPDLWRPQNDTRNFYGPTRLRVGLVQSRNLVSVRLLDAIGIDYTLTYLKNFGFNISKLPNTLSLALGTGAITPLQHTSAFAIFANGGYRVTPHLITHIINANGQTIYRMEPSVACYNCEIASSTANTLQVPPAQSKQRAAPRVISAQVAYLITNTLQDVIQHGTASAARALGRADLAGKTGTTNANKDAWFVGYNPDLLVTTWIGFDQPRSIHEYGAQAALPIWMDFMRKALVSRPPRTLARPAGIVTLSIDRTTGLKTAAGASNSISEIFMQTAVPAETQQQGAGGVYVDPDTGIDHSFNGEDLNVNDNPGEPIPAEIVEPIDKPKPKEPSTLAPVEEPESYEQISD